MAFVRWSSDEGRSDFYVYEDVNGGFTLMLAQSRRSSFEKNPHDFMKDFQAWMDYDNKRRISIEHPDAGKVFNVKTMAEMVTLCRHYINEGFYAPSDMIDKLIQQGKEYYGEEI